MQVYDTIYIWLYEFANYRVSDILLCRLLSPIALIILIWISRIVQSVIVKFLSIVIAIILYFFPLVINVFSRG